MFNTPAVLELHDLETLTSMQHLPESQEVVLTFKLRNAKPDAMMLALTDGTQPYVFTPENFLTLTNSVDVPGTVANVETPVEASQEPGQTQEQGANVPNNGNGKRGKNGNSSNAQDTTVNVDGKQEEVVPLQ